MSVYRLRKGYALNGKVFTGVDYHLRFFTEDQICGKKFCKIAI